MKQNAHDLTGSYRVETRYRLALAVAMGVVVVISAMCVRDSLAWIGRPFNGFLLGRNRIVAPIAQPHWSGPRAGVPYWAQLVAIDAAPVGGVPDALAAAARAGEGGVITYTFATRGGAVALPIAAMRFTVTDYLGLFGNYLCNGLAFLCIGFFVAFLRPRQRAAQALCAFALCWGLSLVISLADFATFAFRDVLAVAEACAPASLLYLSLCFPTAHRLSRQRGVIAALLGISALLAGLNIGLYDRAPQAWTWAYGAGLAWAVIAVVLSVLLLWNQYRGAASPIARERIKIVFLGIAVAFGFPFAAYAGGQLIGSPLPLNVLPVFTWLLPAALAYAIVKRDLFEIDVFLRRAASWAALSAALFAVYVAVVGLFSHGFHDGRLATSPWFTLLFSLAMLAAVRPLRDRLQDAVDRLFFRSRFDYARCTEALSRALTRTLDVREVEAQVREALAATMAPTVCRLFHAGAGEGLRCADAAAPALHPVADTRRALSDGRLLLRGEATAAGDTLAEAALLVPLCFEQRLEGVLLLGPKQSGAAYGPRDIELLRTLANQTAMALRNAASYRRVTELLASLESRVEERTRELSRSHAELGRAYDELRQAQAQLVQVEKMAALGTLVAGVAHEINNPVSFVNSSIDLISTSIGELRAILDRHLDANGAPPLRALREDLNYEYRIAMLEENASICRDGAARAARIVTDLRTFCRPGSGRREPADLHSGLDQSLRLVHGECKGRIAVHRDYGELPRVRCDAGQLSQVFLNLLANAVQAIDGAGDIFVRTRLGNGAVTVEIEDTGRGMDAAVAARVFDPFFTTKDAGDGTGLGLSIARSLVGAHGGAIAVRSRAGHGTTFTLTLPIDGVPHEQL